MSTENPTTCDPAWMTTKQATKALGVHRRTLQRMARDGRIETRSEDTGRVLYHCVAPTAQPTPKEPTKAARGPRTSKLRTIITDEPRRRVIYFKGNTLIYCLRAEGTPLYKIGLTTNFKRRHQSLASGCPYPLSLVWVKEMLGGVVKPAELSPEAWSALHKAWFDRVLTTGVWSPPPKVSRAWSTTQTSAQSAYQAEQAIHRYLAEFRRRGSGSSSRKNR